MTKKSLSIHNGLVVDPYSNSERKADILVANGRIATIAPSVSKGDISIDAGGSIISPGLVELAGHIDLEQAENQNNLRTQLLTASAAGITTLCTAAPQSAAAALRVYTSISKVNLLQPQLLAPISGEDNKLTPMLAFRNAGCIGVSDTDNPVADTRILKRAIEYAVSCDLKLFFHPAEPFLSATGVAAEGEIATRLGLQTIPAAAEAIAVSRVLALLGDMPVAAHFCRLSSARAVSLIAAARSDGINVTADVAIPYLYFDDSAINHYNSSYLLSPPLRSNQDRLALCKAVVDGTITALSADHRFLANNRKDLPLPLANPGMETWDILLPGLLRFARHNSISLPAAFALVSTGPATVLGVAKGKIREGEDADLCIFNPDADAVDNALWQQHKLTGKVTHTIYAGKIVYESDT